MRELSLHLLDIAENSIAAGASMIKIFVQEDTVLDSLRLSVDDNGKGMDEEMITRVTDPFVTSRTTRKVGLGIPLLKEAAESCNGSLKITSEVGKGTRIEVVFQRSHIDRMPLGNLADTYVSLVIASPGIDWQLGYQRDDYEFLYDQKEVRAVLGEISMTDPAVLNYLRNLMSEGLECSLN